MKRWERPAEFEDLEITVTPDGLPDLDTARRYADQGVQRQLLKPPTMDGSAMDDLITRIADTLIGRT